MDSLLIERFFNKQCTPAEAKKVALYLKENPSVLEKYLSKDEWNNLVHNENFSQEFWDELWVDINKKSKAKVISIRIKRFAVAASVICIIASAYFLQAPLKPASVTAAAKTTDPVFITHVVSNTTKIIKKVILPDSSLVMLAPASYISYNVPFQNNKREILLEGEAEFHVTKNKLKPFTVYAGSLATTALGTVFSIKKSGKKNIVIKLFKGKVVIQSTDKNLKGWNNDVYLLPGDEMSFNVKQALVTVEKNNAVHNQDTIAKIKIKQPVADSLRSELLFSNEKLSIVLNKLAMFYDVHIQYDSLVIDTMNFTGTVSKHDSIPVILKAISGMNNLEVIQNDKGYIIQQPTSN